MREGREASFAKGLEEGKLEGLQQGHQAGLEQGREEGLALGRDQVEQEVARWRALATRLATPLSELDGAVEQQLIVLVQQLAQAPLSAMRRKPPRHCCWRPSSRGWPCCPPPSRGHPDAAS